MNSPYLERNIAEDDARGLVSEISNGIKRLKEMMPPDTIWIIRSPDLTDEEYEARIVLLAEAYKLAASQAPEVDYLIHEEGESSEEKEGETTAEAGSPLSCMPPFRQS